MEDKNSSFPLAEVDEKEKPVSNADIHMSEDVHHHHSHHHHSHRHRRRRRHSPSSKKENKAKRFLKKYRSVLINIVACTLAIVMLILFAVTYDRSQSPEGNVGSSLGLTQSSIQIESTIYMEEVPLVHEAIFSYMDPDNEKSAHEIYGLYKGYEQVLNIAMPLKYSYTVSGLPSGVAIQSAVLVITEAGQNEELRYPLELNGASVSIYHLKVGTVYGYRLELTLSNGKTVGTTGAFDTVTSPRILKINGAVNVRDIGGWQITESGKRIKQGLLYRGSELDGAVEPSYAATDEGVRELVERLGVRFDMDLRSPTVNAEPKDALGPTVEHQYYSVAQYTDIFQEENQENLRAVFADLADESHYPIYMHCTYGKDRTGTVCYLLEALLGVTERDLYREYELSAFTDSYVNREAFASFLTRIDLLEGNTVAEKVEGYLLSIGVTAEEIESIRNIFLEP